MQPDIIGACAEEMADILRAEGFTPSVLYDADPMTDGLIRLTDTLFVNLQCGSRPYAGWKVNGVMLGGVPREDLATLLDDLRGLPQFHEPLFRICAHPYGYSVHTRPAYGWVLPSGAGKLTKSEAQLVCDSANETLRLLGMLRDS